MSLTRKKTAELNTSSTVKAAKRTQQASAAAAANTVKAAKQAQKAGSAAAANAASAAQNAAATAQNAAGLAQTAAQNATVVATNAALSAGDAAQTAAANLSDAAQTAAANLSDAAQTATANLNKGVRQGVFSARSWAAPRLENAADYTSNTVAPKVSAALRATARQVSPPDAKGSRRRVLAWTALGVAIAAALGAAAAMARYRFRTAIAADSETADEEVMADSADSQPAPVSEGGQKPADPKSKDQGAETTVNGQVTPSGW
jgi:hypothetical protein